MRLQEWVESWDWSSAAIPQELDEDQFEGLPLWKRVPLRVRQILICKRRYSNA